MERWIMFTITGTSNATLIVGPNILSTNSINLPDCIIFDSWIFKNFILADEPFSKALQNLKTCVLVKNSLWGKSSSLLELPTIFDKIFTVTLFFYSWF